MRLFRRTALLATAALLGLAALGTEPAILRDASFEAAGGRISIGAARVPLLSAAFAQNDQIALENVTVTLGASTYAAKRVVFSGVTSSRADVEALFSPNSTEPLAARLARINARQIAVPELTVSVAMGPTRQRSTYRNLVASDIRGGRIADLAIEEGLNEVEGPKRAVSAHKRLTLKGLAATDLARVYFEKAGSQPAPLTRVYDAFAVEDIRHQDGDGTVLKIARANGRDILMRPTAESWSGSTSLIAAMAELDQPSSADSSRLVASLADMLGAFEIGLAEMHGLDMTGPSEKGEPIALRLRRLAYSGAAAQPADLRLEGFELAAPDGSARFASLTFTGFSFEATRQGLMALKGRSLEDLDAATLRTLIPTIGTMRFSGLDFDVPNEADQQPKPERIRFTVKEIEFTADRPLNGIPTNIRIGLQNLAMPLPATSDEEGLKDLVALGYKSLDLSLAAAATWNEAGQEIVLREVSASGAEMLNLRATGVIGNVTRDVFHADTALATVAALGASAKSLDITVENTGLFERYIAQEAKKQRRTPESLRREYGSTAAFAIPALLGNSDQAKGLGQAVARFVAKPARLRIAARARSAAGLGIADVMSIASPTDVLQQLEIRATTEERL
ncbi:MAG TPA: hypothetical protein VGU45_07760 [Microvirga sp.]|jgi:hypothetical protein|nr:hypothetical protein [Microvirga sp.]